MGKIIVVTGGCRSGKSAYAQQLAESLPEPRYYLATCPPIDEEMRQRIRRHQEQRAQCNWQTIEEEVDVARAIMQAGDGTILLDCLTLWINNLMYEAENRRAEVSEDDIAAAADGLLRAARERRGTTIFVTNEVGMGIIPDNPIVRRYRDLAGRCNQIMGAAADEVVLMVSGIPMTVKKENESKS